MPLISLSQAGRQLQHLEPRVLFSDVDGTLLGRGGSLFATFDGTPTSAAAEAMFAVHQAGLRLVLVSGRTQAQLRETGRLLGIPHAIAELGTVLVIDGTAALMWGEVPRDLGNTPARALLNAGVARWVLEVFEGRVEFHEPPHAREGTILLRGQLSPTTVNDGLAQAGYGWARLYDNGQFNRPFSHLGPDRTHAYHLTPTGVTKASTARAYLERQGLLPNQAAAIGDSPTDLELAEVVGATFVVANGRWALEETPRPETIITTEGSAGEGWAEAVTALLNLMK